MSDSLAAARRVIDNLHRDLGHAVRTLRRSPGFTFVAVVTLTLGIACTTAAFSIVSPILLRGQPYRSPNELRTIYEMRDDGGLRTPSYPTFRDWQAQTAGASSPIAGLTFVRGDGVSLPGPDGPSRVIDAYVSPGFFDVMGTAPYLGRTFRPDEEQPGAAAVALISYDLFIDRFGGDRSTVGRTIDLDSVPATIIGVMPRAFAYPNFGGNSWVPPQVWQPLQVDAARQPNVLTLRGLHVDSRTLVRLRSGVDSATAASAMHVVEQRLAAQYPTDQAHWTRVSLQSMRSELFGSLPRSLLLISGAIGLVLLLACANVANLFLVRAAAQGREIAVRVALGAGRGRIISQLFAESLTLSVIAGAVGTLMAAALIGYARHSLGALLPMADQLRLDGTALLFAVGASMLTAMLVGLGPAISASGPRTMERIRSGGIAAAGGRHERRARNLLVSLQFALALTLLVGSGLLIQSFRRMLDVPLGYDQSNLVQFAIAPGSHDYDSPQAAAALYQRIVASLASLPHVETAAATGGALLNTTVVKAGAAGGADATQSPMQAIYHPVSLDYLRMLRIPMVAGRWFTEQDMRAATGLVISQRLATRLWGRGPARALGERITIRRQSQARADFGAPITLPVIGVVADVRESGPTGDPDPEVYLPYTLEVWPWMNFALRAPQPDRLLKSVKESVRALDPAAEFWSEPNVSRTGAGSIDAQRRFVTEVLAGFALGALLLAGTGLYGIVAYHVSQRTREIGIRIALGASRREVSRLVVRDGVLFVLLGAAIGTAASLAGTRLLQALLFQTASTDPETFIAVPVVLATVALAACYLPARRAARIDPTIAMRAE